MKRKFFFQIPVITITICITFASAHANPERVKGQEGDACDRKTFLESCDGNKLLRCINERVEGIDCSALGISGLAKVCVEFESGAVHPLLYAKCMDEEDRCYQANESITREKQLESGKTINQSYICEKTTSGDLFYRPTTADAKYERVHSRPKPKKAASNDTGNTLGKHNGESCDKEKALFEFCEINSLGITWEVVYRCERSQNGDVLHLRKHSQTTCHNGLGTCSPDGKCIPGEKCDPSSYVAHCKENEAFNCSNLTINHRKCPGKNSCLVIDNKAQCINSDNKSCKNEGEIVPTRCAKDREFYSECKRATDGNLYYVSAGNKKCPKGCNENKTACNP